MTEKKFQKYLNHKDLKRWYDSASRGSLITADVNLRRLGSFCERTGLEPHELLDMEPKALTDRIDDFVTDMEKEGLSPNYIQSILKGVKSWLSHNNIALTRKIKVTNSGKNRLKERVPTQEELKRIFASGDPRSRVASILMAHSGVRPEVIGNYTGKDGLNIGDFPEMVIGENEVSFEKIPTAIVVREELSKAGNEYFTFLGQEGCFYLKAYIEERMRSGEKITSSSPIIVPSKLAYAGHFISTINIGDIIRRPIRNAGYQWRPYVLRGYFDTQLMMAESKGLIIRDYRTFFMGHKGGIEGTYTTGKVQNPESIENMRESYEKALKFLETEQRGISDEDKQSLEKTLTGNVLKKVFGFTEEEIEELIDLTDEELQKKIQEKTGNAKDKESLRQKAHKDAMEIAKRRNGSRQIPIPVGFVEEYMQEGFEFVAGLNGDKAIMRLP